MESGFINRLSALDFAPARMAVLSFLLLGAGLVAMFSVTVSSSSWGLAEPFGGWPRVLAGLVAALLTVGVWLLMMRQDPADTQGP